MRLGASAAWLGGCTLASQVLLLGSLPLITRLFGPEQFGTYTLFVGALAIAGVFVGLRYESAAVVAESDREAAVLVVVVLLSGVAMALLTLLVATVLQVGWPRRPRNWASAAWAPPWHSHWSPRRCSVRWWRGARAAAGTACSA